MQSELQRQIDFRLFVITDRHLCRGSLIDTVAQASRSGVKAFQVREKDMTAYDLFRCAAELLVICREYNSWLFVNDRADVAGTVGASGVQLTSHRMPVPAARRCLQPEQLVGVSTHSLEEASKAEAEGADFVLYGPIFETASKAGYGPPRGLPGLRIVGRSLTVPVFAVGGITPQRAALCLDEGARGVAVISAVMTSRNVPQTVNQFKNAMGKL